VRSFTAAARRESGTQPGVSQHVRKLEAAIGARLFERDKPQVQPTPAGEQFYARAVELLRMHRSSVQDMQISSTDCKERWRSA
jgi:DNA-binding transcriptional LysR family regulator